MQGTSMSNPEQVSSISSDAAQAAEQCGRRRIARLAFFLPYLQRGCACSTAVRRRLDRRLDWPRAVQPGEVDRRGHQWCSSPGGANGSG